MALFAGLGCARSHRNGPSAAPESSSFRLLETAPIAFAGEALVVSIATAEGPDPRGRAVRAQLEDGRQIRAEHHRLSISPPADEPIWLHDTRRWRVAPSENESWTPALAADVLVIDLPSDAFGLTLHVQNAPLPLTWRALPEDNFEHIMAAPFPAELRAPEAQSNLFRHLAPALADPLQRWRCRLLAQRLSRHGFHALTERINAATFENAALEALARQTELRWRAALSRAASADTRAATEFVQALTNVASIDSTHAVPVWTPTQLSGASTGLERLQNDLLSPSLDDASILTRLDAWLSAQPRAVAWVIDDTGAADPQTRLSLPRVGVTDLSGRGGIAQALLDAAQPGPRITVAPLATAAAVASGDFQNQFTRIQARLGEWTQSLTVAPQPLLARPPGARLFPLLEPWTLESWQTGVPVTESIADATAALLRRTSAGQWELMIECKTDSDPIASGDFVRVHLGPSLHPRAILRIDPRGSFIDELEPRKEDEPPTRRPIVVQRAHDRWICILTIPPEAIESDRYLRIALERGDADGRRATWPRPVMPWAEAPGRAMFDLGDWLELEQPTLR